MAIGAHFLIEGERLNAQKILGLIISRVGLVWAFSDRGLDGVVWKLDWGPDERSWLNVLGWNWAFGPVEQT